MTEGYTSTEGHDIASQKLADKSKCWGKTRGVPEPPQEGVSTWDAEHQANQKRSGVRQDNPQWVGGGSCSSSTARMTYKHPRSLHHL